MGSIPVRVTKKEIGTPCGCLSLFCAPHNLEPSVHTTLYSLLLFVHILTYLRSDITYRTLGFAYRPQAVYCVARSNTAIIDIQGTLSSKFPRAADSRTCLPLGAFFACFVPLLSTKAHISSPGKIPLPRYAPEVRLTMASI